MKKDKISSNILNNLEDKNNLEQIKKQTNEELYKVKVTCPLLNVRCGPNFNYKVIQRITDNDICSIFEEQNGFGKIDQNKDLWIKLEFTEKK